MSTSRRTTLARFPFARARRDAADLESGDTLLEVIIAIVVISIGVVALVGALTASITDSVTYRSLASLDTILKNFAEAAKYDVQLQSSTSSTYANCDGASWSASGPPSYEVVSEYPTTATTGSTVTVFGSGFQPATPVTLALGAVPITTFTGDSQVASDGTISTTFVVPTGVSGTSEISLNSVSSAPPLMVPATGPTTFSAVSGYRVRISSVAYWDNSITAGSPAVFDTSCGPNNQAGIQMIGLLATAPNNVSDSLSIAVSAPDLQPVMTVKPLPPVMGQLSFTATLAGSQGGGFPAGSVAWSIDGGSSICGSTALQQVASTTVSTTTCPISVPGSYQVVATYNPSSTSQYDSTTGYASGTLVASSILTLASPSSPTTSMTLPFTVTVSGTGGVVPTGSITWVSSNPGSLSCAASSALHATGSNTSATQITCTATAPGSYLVTAIYSGDANYNSTRLASSAVNVT